MSRRRTEPGPFLLIFAEPLQREGLRRWLEDPERNYRLESQEEDAAAGMPALVIWSLTTLPPEAALDAEVRQLLERWQPAPLLLLLPRGHGYSQRFLLSLPLQGLLEDADATTLRQSVATLLEGGRVVEIQPQLASTDAPGRPPIGLGEWLLVSGLQQIEAELRVCERLLAQPAQTILGQLLLEGRQRELRAARGLLAWLWGPLAMAWGDLGAAAEAPLSVAGPRRATAQPPLIPAAVGGGGGGGGLSLTLRQRSADGIWEALRERLNAAAHEGPYNGSGQLLALDGLQADRKRDLLLALLEQFELLRRRLQEQDTPATSFLSTWQELQPELRRQALRRMAGSYVQIPAEGVLRPVADTLMQTASFDLGDPDLPDPTAMLTTLVDARPMLVEGRLLAPDEPQALLYLELLLANWLVRSAELISAEVLEVCAGWPELRRYLLRPDLLATRNLERLRNQLNAQQRWTSWIARPVRLYESRRPLYKLQAGMIETVDITEPRDQELRRLGWLQQLVTLALEARDALAPQVQSLVRGLGDLLVVVLTQVVGRAIGLVGRGIAQGMGRSLGRG
ncbi:MAG: DUF3685 domain-containing protein [Cyanobium sp.]